MVAMTSHAKTQDMAAMLDDNKKKKDQIFVKVFQHGGYEVNTLSNAQQKSRPNFFFKSSNTAWRFLWKTRTKNAFN